MTYEEMLDQSKSDDLLMPDDFIRGRMYRWTMLTFIAVIAAGIYTWFSVNAPMTREFDWFSGFTSALVIASVITHSGKWHIALQHAAWLDQLAWDFYEELVQHKKISAPFMRGCVYILQDMDVTQWYKIGKSTNAKNRIGHFDTMLPFETRVVHVISAKNCNALEAMLHTHFAHKRKRGEWFALSDADVAWIQALEEV